MGQPPLDPGERIAGVASAVVSSFVTPAGPLAGVLVAAVWLLANGRPALTVLLAGVAGAVVAVATGALAFALILGGEAWMNRRWAPGAMIVLWVCPTLLSVATVLLVSGLLAQVPGDLLVVVLIGVVFAGGAGAVAYGLSVRRERRAHADAMAVAEVARRERWLRERHASAAADPELAAALLAEGWRPDGPYEEMHALYLRAWEQVKSARRASGRPIFVSSEAPPRDPEG